VPFTEGLFTGYRWYDARRIEPQFAFGHGLSYTTFEYSGLSLETSTDQSGQSVTVSLQVRNTGPRAGQEVVQVYVSERQPRLVRPPQQLAAFAKVRLAPGQAQTVRLTLGPREFAVYDPRVAAWVVAPGDYDVRVGSSSRDIRVAGTVTLAGSGPRAPFTGLTPLREWVSDPAGKAAVWPGVRALVGMFGVPPEAAESVVSGPLFGFIGDFPVNKLVMFGVFTEAQLDEMLAQANAGR
jgi:beta-glucosidase